MSMSKVKKFVKNHKYDIVIVGGIIMIVVGGVVIYKTGFKSGVNAMHVEGFKSNWHCETNGGKFIFTSDVVSKAGEYTINQEIDSDQAIKLAKFILKETGCIKELVKVGAEIAEVTANG